MTVNNTLMSNKEISGLITSHSKVKFRPKTYEEVKNFAITSSKLLSNATVEIDYFKYLESLIESNSELKIETIMESYLQKYDYRKRYSDEVIQKIKEYDITSDSIKDAKLFAYSS